jgi:hypothetical protein
MIRAPRFAIYLAPEPHDALWKFGSSWLGYDAGTGTDVSHPKLHGVSMETLREATAHPRLYGLHITLKAPFRLASGYCVPDLEGAVEALATRHDPLGPVPLRLEARDIDDDHVFLCLAPSDMEPALHRLEADTVVTLDRFRAPLTPADIARRKPDRLSAQKRDYLEVYGYPHVLDCFRPHLSLTGPIRPESPLRAALAERLSAELGLMSLTCNSILLVEQPEPAARFRIRQRYRL